MTDIRETLKNAALVTAQREGWRGAAVRITASRKANKLSLRMQFSGDPGVAYDVEGVLGRAFVELRARQTAEVQAQWPEIVVTTFIMLGATSTGATTSWLDDTPPGAPADDARTGRLWQPAFRPVGSPPWGEP